MPKTRKSYTTERKLQVIKLAEKVGNRAAGREYGIDESVVRDWKKNKAILETMNPRRRALRSGIPLWPTLESKLKTWVLNERKDGRVVHLLSIIMKAREMANADKITNFNGTLPWCQRFMKRHSLCIRVPTSVGQPLPPDWETKAKQFNCFIERNKVDISLQHIGNMDEVPMSFDMPSKFTVDSVGADSVKVTTTGAEKCNFTVALAVTADGEKLSPFVIFKRKTIPKADFPKGVIVRAQEKGWMNTEMMCQWWDQVWSRRKGSFFNPKSLLVLDSAPAHLTSEVKDKFKNTTLAVIPGGLTKILQPLDISVNKSFKSKIRRHWEQWMVNGYHEYTKSGRMKKASYEEVCKWIDSSWREITPECIKNGFIKSKVNYYDNNQELEEVETDSECTDTEIPDELIEIIDNFNIDSDNDFD